jgi:hypothetical protein
MNDSVDLARDVTKPPDDYFDLGKMLKELISKNVPVKAVAPVKCAVEYIKVSLILKVHRKLR